MNFLDGWRKASKTVNREVASIRVVKKWCRPIFGWMKINVDGAVFLTEVWLGLLCGIIMDALSGAGGEGGVTKPFFYQTTPMLVEALGVREMLSWIHDRGWSRVIVEIDCLQVV